MVSGFVTSPEDHDRICLEDARPISMASKLLMSIKAGAFVGSWSWSRLLGVAGVVEVVGVGGERVVRHPEVPLGDDLVRLVVGGEVAVALGLLRLLGVLGGDRGVRRGGALLVGHRVAGAHAGEV